MIPPRFDVVAIGNALVDVLCHKDDGFVAAQGLKRGLMQPIAPDRAVALHAAMGQCEEVCGGSAANTMAALARLGLRLAFVGQVGDDRLGRLFADDMAAGGIAFPLPPIDRPTGRCLIIVSPDGHRTMNTAIGASEYLPPAAFDSAIAADAAILYVEGYMWRTDEPRAAARAALEVARAHDRRTAFTLSSEYCVQQHRDDFVGLLEAGLIDILFANEGELAELSGRSDFEAGVAWAAARVPLLIATRGAEGRSRSPMDCASKPSPSLWGRSSTRPGRATCSPPGCWPGWRGGATCRRRCGWGRSRPGGSSPRWGRACPRVRISPRSSKPGSPFPEKKGPGFRQARSLPRRASPC
jgi:sugar/nucleoside kinase (ribokinase family)